MILVVVVKGLHSLKSSDLVEPDGAALIESDQQFAASARLGVLDRGQFRVSEFDQLRGVHLVAKSGLLGLVAQCLGRVRC